MSAATAPKPAAWPARQCCLWHAASAGHRTTPRRLYRSAGRHSSDCDRAIWPEATASSWKMRGIIIGDLPHSCDHAGRQAPRSCGWYRSRQGRRAGKRDPAAGVSGRGSGRRPVQGDLVGDLVDVVRLDPQQPAPLADFVSGHLGSLHVVPLCLGRCGAQIVAIKYYFVCLGHKRDGVTGQAARPGSWRPYGSTPGQT
jgi:hypothetical protein